MSQFDLRDKNPAQAMKILEDDWQAQFGIPVPHNLKAGFIAGIAAGIAMTIFRDKKASFELMQQCQDIAATMAQLENMGLVK